MLSETFIPSSREETLNRMVREAEIPLEGTILDVDCGSGRTLFQLRPHLCDRRARYVGVSSAISAARRVAEDFALTDYARFRETGAWRSVLPLRSRTVDVAFSALTAARMTLHRRVGFFREVHRTLRGGGWLHLIEPSSVYDPRAIVEESRTRDAGNGRAKRLGYRWMLRTEQRFANGLPDGGYDEPQIARELEAAHFTVVRAERCEQGNVLLVSALKREQA